MGLILWWKSSGNIVRTVRVFQSSSIFVAWKISSVCFHNKLKCTHKECNKNDCFVSIVFFVSLSSTNSSWCSFFALALLLCLLGVVAVVSLLPQVSMIIFVNYYDISLSLLLLLSVTSFYSLVQFQICVDQTFPVLGSTLVTICRKWSLPLSLM